MTLHDSWDSPSSDNEETADLIIFLLLLSLWTEVNASPLKNKVVGSNTGKTQCRWWVMSMSSGERLSADMMMMNKTFKY